MRMRTNVAVERIGMLVTAGSAVGAAFGTVLMAPRRRARAGIRVAEASSWA